MSSIRKLMMSFGTVVAVSGVTVFAAAESMSGSSRVLGAAEVTQELFGMAMQGVSGTTKNRWRECIEPDGDTVYHLDGIEMRGRLTVTSQGLACFAYEHQSYQSPVCFKVSRNRDGEGYTFWGGSEGVYKTQMVVRGVEACPVDFPPVG